MRQSPSIIPWGDLDRTVYLVLTDSAGAFLRRRYVEYYEVPDSIFDFLEAHRR
jgi:hypothetical protein